MDPRRAHAISRPAEGLAALALRIAAADEIARHQEHFLPVVVHERHGGERASLDLQDARAVADLVLLVERAGDDLFREPPRIARHGVKAVLHVDSVEFLVTLVVAHGALPASLCRRTLPAGGPKSRQVQAG